MAVAQSARKGVLDLRKVNFNDHSPVSLKGEWEFYMFELVSPGEIKSKKPQEEYIDFPSTWNGLNETADPGNGYATYRLRVMLEQSPSLALELPHFYSSYVLWLNGERIASNGKVGTSAKEMVPQWLPQIVNIPVIEDTLDILIQVSNFHHAKGGIREEILLGSSDSLTVKRSIAISSYLVMFSILLLISTIIFIIYLISSQDASTLYLAALSMTWAVRSMFSNLYLANHFIPGIPWDICVKIEYVSLYLSMVWAIFFIGTIFRNEVNRMFIYVFSICNVMFVVITVVFEPVVFTRFLPVYLSFAALLLIYVIYVLIRAIVYERENVWLMVSSLFLAVILFSYDLISYERFANYNPIIISIGYLTIFTLLSLSLLYKLGLLKRTSSTRNVLTYEDLYGPSDSVK